MAFLPAIEGMYVHSTGLYCGARADGREAKLLCGGAAKWGDGEWHHSESSESTAPPPTQPTHSLTPYHVTRPHSSRQQSAVSQPAGVGTGGTLLLLHCCTADE